MISCSRQSLLDHITVQLAPRAADELWYGEDQVRYLSNCQKIEEFQVILHFFPSRSGNFLLNMLNLDIDASIEGENRR